MNVHIELPQTARTTHAKFMYVHLHKSQHSASRMDAMVNKLNMPLDYTPTANAINYISHPIIAIEQFRNRQL